MTGTPPSSFWRWIDPQAVPAFQTGEKLLLFGAGQGTTEFLRYNKEQDIQVEYVAIADNNLSLTGKKFQGIEVIDPATLSACTFDRLIVTTVSGRQAVARQLDAMGFSGRYVCIASHPTAWRNTLCLIESYNNTFHFLKPGIQVLHAEPEGFFGIELALYLYGCQPHSLALSSCSAAYPLPPPQQKTAYDALHTHLQTSSGISRDVLASRYKKALPPADTAPTFNTRAIPLYSPHSIEKMPFDDASMDLVLSFSLLEHVRDPEQALREIYRVLKPSGLCLHRIITADHRSFGNREGFHPFSFFSCTESQWNSQWSTAAHNTFYQNRILPAAWFRLFQQEMDILFYKEQIEYTLTDAQWEGIKKTCPPEIKRTSLNAVVCDIIAIKPA